VNTSKTIDSDQWYNTVNIYSDDFIHCSIFYRVKEKFGGLSNMSNDFSIQINGYNIANNEALYQACRFPDYPEIQKEIITERSGIAAKMKSKKYRNTYTRSDWNDIRIDIMRFCLQLKLQQNKNAFGALLKSTDNTEIVERSRRDAFWGAIWDEDIKGFVGQNVLGKLLIELRDWYSNCEVILNENGTFNQHYIEPIHFDNFKLLGENIIY
jgi:ribA/ribD-fused uncharacterized protein